jgi:membrane protease YdiL (CAAX protease family)
VTSNDQSSSKTNDFAGIWDRRQKPEQVVETAKKYAEELPEVGVKRSTKTVGWGFGSVFVAFIVYLLAQFGVLAIFTAQADPTDPLGSLNALSTNPVFLVLTALAGYAVWGFAMLITTYKKGLKNFSKEYWFKFKKKDLLIGPGIGLGILVFATGLNWLLSDVVDIDMSGASNTSWLTAQSGAWFIVMAVGLASIIGPFFEELFFRGYAFQGVVKGREKAFNRSEASTNRLYLWWVKSSYKIRYTLAVIISSVFFGFMHYQGSESFGQWYVVILTGLLGLVFALTTLRFKRLGPAILAHMTYNGCNLLLAVLLSM